MKNLVKLASILQLTKEQPLTGYALGGFQIHEMPTLAEHHYTAGLLAFLLVQKIKEAGGIINERKVLLMVFIHDLAELFGGDISGPLNRKYPDLREYKDKIGCRTMNILTDFLDENTKQEIMKLSEEFENRVSDEAVVARICDQMDHQFFLEHHNFKLKYNPRSGDYRPNFLDDYIFKQTEAIQDQKTKEVINDFLKEFANNYYDRGFQGISILMGK